MKLIDFVKKYLNKSDDNENIYFDDILFRDYLLICSREGDVRLSYNFKTNLFFIYYVKNELLTDFLQLVINFKNNII